MIAQVAMGAMRKIEGPRLKELDVTLAEYGTPLPRFWGIRRFEGCPIICAEKIREKKKKSKGKAGKYAEYRYYGSWGVAIADQEIEAVTRIWLDKHLCIQMTGSGPIAQMWAAMGAFGEGDIKLDNKALKIYLGTEDQQPDPHYVALCEDKHGPNSAPAFRGTAWAWFNDIPLEKFGNRIPQVTIEAVSKKTDSYPYETITDGNGSGEGFAFNGGWVAQYSSFGQILWFDSASRTKLGYSPEPDLFSGSVSNVALGPDGTAYCAGVELSPGTPEYFVVTPPLGVPQRYATDTGPTFFEITRWTPAGVFTAYFTKLGYMQFATHIADPMVARDFSRDDEEPSIAWGLFQPSGASDEFTIKPVAGGFSPPLTFSGSMRTAVTAARFTIYQGRFFVTGGDGSFYIIDKETGAILDSGPALWGNGVYPFFRQQGEESFWHNFSEYSLVDGSLLRTESVSNWVFVGVHGPESGYDPVLNAIWAKDTGSSSVRIFYLDRVGNSDVLLSDIVGDVFDWSGIDDYDVSALNQTVTGYSVTQGTGKEIISPLLDIHDSDIRPHDFSLQGVKRGAVSGGTINVSDFVREGDQDRYAVDIKQDTELPLAITFNFADVGKDQATNNVNSTRSSEAADSAREQTIDLTTYVLEPNAAQGLADRYLRRVWNSKETINLGLTAQQLALEPGDVRTLGLDEVSHTARLAKVTYSGGALNTEWIRDFSGLATLGSADGPVMGGRDPEVIFSPGPTKGFVLDIPLIEDADSSSNPLVYYAAGNYGTDWAGAAVLEADLDGEYDEVAGISSSDASTWGIANNVLGTANPWLWDRGNSVNLKVFGGSLSTVTEADIDADPTLNMAYLGGELLNFTAAVLETDGSYTLSGFKRGRRGTEWAIATHAAGEDFLLLTEAGVEAQGLSEVGTDLAFKVQSLGRDPDFASAIEFEPFSGATLTPYAPARINWTTDGTDLSGEIIRRTRVGGAWTGGSTIPLSENSEAYEVDVMDGTDVLRTIAVTGTNTFTYAAADIASDGGTVSVPPDVNVYQLSDAVGRGFALAA